MTHELCEASLHVVERESVVVPLIIRGLPERVDALGRRWVRKREFHLTVLSAATVQAASGGRDGVWDLVASVLSSRSIGRVAVRRELRRVRHPDRPDLHTIVAMAQAPGLDGAYRDLSSALGVVLSPPPAHVTLYSSDPASGIGIDDERELAERAPALSREEHEELASAIGFDAAFVDDAGIPADVCDERTILLGGTDHVFTPRALRAIAYAAHVHRHQRRKSTGIPYLAHLLSVAGLTAEDGGDETEVIVALLHDTAEDHGGERRLDDIARRFGPDVASMVRALSDSLRPEGAMKERWRPRKERYLQHLRDEGRPGVLRVSNADKLHNARAILADYRQVGDMIWSRFDGTPEQQLWYYTTLAALFLERRPESALARELAETIRELEAEMRAAR